MTSDAFARAWDEIHRSAHTAATSALTGEVKGDTITLNVGTVIEELQEQLIGVSSSRRQTFPVPTSRSCWFATTIRVKPVMPPAGSASSS